MHEVNGPEARHLNQLEPVKQNVPLPDMEPVAIPPAVNKVEAAVPTTTKNHGLIGLALTMGFVLMFLVDHLGNEACARPLFSIFHCFCCQRRSNDLLLRKLPLLCKVIFLHDNLWEHRNGFLNS